MKKLYSALIMLLACYHSHAQSNVVAHWKFDGNLADSSGNGLHGSGQNVVPTTGVNGQPNTAYLFNGIDAYMGVAYKPVMNLNNYTFAATVKVNGFYNDICQAEFFMMRGIEWSNGNYGFAISDNAFDGNDCYSFDSTQFAYFAYTPVVPIWNYASNNKVPYQQWKRIAISYDGSNIRTYVNGQLDLTIPASAPIGTSTDSMVIGSNYGYNVANYPYWFNGAMDDMILYNVALSDSAIINEGCGSFVATQPIDTLIFTGGIAQFTTSSGAEGTTYQWQADAGNGFYNLTNNTNYNGVASDTLMVYSNGLTDSIYYRCIITNSLNCKDTTVAALLDIDAPTSINGIATNSGLRIFPNPAKEKVVVSYYGKEKVQSVVLTDMQGRIIHQQGSNGIDTQIDLISVATGIYLINLYDVSSKLIATQKFVVQ